MDEEQHQAVFEHINNPYPIRLYFAASKAGWDWLMQPMHCDDPYPGGAGRCSVFELKDDGTDEISGPPVIIITLGDMSNVEPQHAIGVMVHECTHALQFIEETCFLKGDTQNKVRRFDDETEAYLMQSMIMWLMSSFADSGRKFKDDFTPEGNDA
jgi:hypothetical protein